MPSRACCGFVFQVLPFSAGDQAGADGPISVFEFNDAPTVYSGGQGGNCVEVAQPMADIVAVRDGKNPDGPELAFSPSRWQEFTRRLKRAGLAAYRSRAQTANPEWPAFTRPRPGACQGR